MEELFHSALRGNLTWLDVSIIILLSWLSQFVVWLAKQFCKIIGNRNKPNSHDIEVYERYKLLFDENLVSFCQNYNFANPVKEQLEEFKKRNGQKQFKNAEWIFLNKELNKYRTHAIDAIETLSNNLWKLSIGVNPYWRDENWERNTESSARTIAFRLKLTAQEAAAAIRNFHKAAARHFNKKV